MARVAVTLAVILSLFVLSHARLSPEPTTTTTTTATTISSETSADADQEPSETLDPTVHVVPLNRIGDGSLPAGDILRHIDFSLRRPIYHHRHNFRHFHGHRRHRMRAMEIVLGLPGDRIPLRSSEEKGLVKEEAEEGIKGEKPAEEEEIEKREVDSDSDSDSDSGDDEEEKMEKMEKRKRKCKKNKKHHHLHRFHHHRHRHEQDEAEKSGFMKRFWDFLNHF